MVNHGSSVGTQVDERLNVTPGASHSTVLKIFAHRVKQQHRHRLGIFANGKSPDCGQHHQCKLVEYIAFGYLLARLLQYGQPYGQICQHKHSPRPCRQRIGHNAHNEQQGSHRHGQQCAPHGGFVFFVMVVTATAAATFVIMAVAMFVMMFVAHNVVCI